MGLFGLALDGNPGPKHQLFVADMNGRILTVGLGAHAGRAEGLLAGPGRQRASPATGCSRCGTTSSSTRPATCTCPTTSRGSGACRPDGTAHDLVHRSAADRAASASPADRSAGGSTRPASGCTSRSRWRPSSRRRRTRRSTGSASSTTRPPPTCSSSIGSGVSRPDRSAAAGDGPRVREVRQPVRQPARSEPGRGPRPGRQRDPPDLRSALLLAVGPRVHRQLAARDERRSRARRPTPTPGRSSRSTSARPVCRSTGRACR